MRGLDFVFPYIDDILVASNDAEQRNAHLRQLFDRLAHYGVSVNPDKCVYGPPDFDYLGHRIDA